ncbi:hypothetical protein EU538_02720 [Candidatus Thorarchaeota archaeon]|nr:MAG: hypothetical protein EU538_02720 [Candidatus Thorarchaeota archaeon]
MEVEPKKEGRHFYKVQQKLVAARPVYEVYDEETGEKVAVGRQTWLSFLRSTVNFEDPEGNKILTAKGGFFDKTFHLLDPSGNKIAKITRPWIMFRKRFTMHYRDEEIHAQGGIMAWGFEAVSRSGHFGFKLDKKIIAVRDQFRVEVGDYMDWRHAVASAIVVDRIFFRGKGCGCRLICCFAFLAVFVALIFASMLMGP